MRRAVLTPTLAMLALAACTAATVDPDGADSNRQRDRIAGEVVVFAASSLTEAFNDIAEAFRAEYPDAELVLNFAGSSDLVGQINDGAPADVLVSADDENMSRLTDAGMNATEPVVMARNTLAIIVEEGNPLGVAALADLAANDLVLVLCALEVPCGNGASQVLANAGIGVTPRSYESQVKGVVTKVSEGEADAGIVFVTDVLTAAGSLDGVDIPADVNVIVDYLVAATAEATNPVGARAFIDFVMGDAGQAILAKYGFLAP